MRQSSRRLLLLHVSAVFVMAWQQQPRTAPAKAVSELERAADEFKIVTRDLGLRTDGGAARAKSRSPRPSWHGRVFENFRNDILDATPHEIAQRNEGRNLLRRNQFGFNIGGPLVIPKLFDGSRSTFVSVSYEGVRERIARSYLQTVATDAERTGNFSQTVNSSGDFLPIYDPASTRPNPAFDPNQAVSTSNLEYLRDPFPNNTIPVNRLDPVAARSVGLYPHSNTNAGPFFRNNYFVVSPETNSASGMIFKVDHTLSDRHRLAFNGSFTNGFAGAPRYINTIADAGSNDSEYSAKRGYVDWTFTKSSRTVNTLTVDVQADRSISGREGQENALDEIGLQGPLSGAFPVFRFADYMGMGRTNPIARSSHTNYFLTDAFSTRIGKHSLRASAQLRHTQVNAFLPLYPAGNFSFGPAITSLPGINNTGYSFASFLLGHAQYADATVTMNPSYWRRGMFLLSARDTYEYSKSLNFTVSANIEGTGPRIEKYDRFASVDLGAVNPLQGLPGALEFAGLNGHSRSFQPYRFNPEASFSLAWNPNGNAKSVLRMSYAFSFSSVPVYTTQWSTQGFTARPTYIPANNQLVPALTLRDGMPPLSQPVPDLRPDAANFTSADLVEPTGTQPLYQSAGLSYERELLGQTLVSISLSHARGQHLYVGNSAANPNAIPLSNLSYRDDLNNENFRRTLRPYPQYQRFDVYSSWPSGNYKRNSASIRLEKRSTSGLTANVTYEFSKQMDDYSGPYGVQDFYNFTNEWSLTSSNNPHRLSFSYAYELPIGSKKPLLAFSDWRRFMVDGWTLSGISTVLSGEPLALRPQFNNTGGLIDALRVDLVPGVDPNVANKGPALWFNPAAFDQPADFTPGNGPRTHPQLLGPGSQNHDLSVSKRFAISTERALELTATGFNFINHANWTDPDVMIGPASAPNVNAGKIIGSVGGRVIQVGMRFSF